MIIKLLINLYNSRCERRSIFHVKIFNNCKFVNRIVDVYLERIKCHIDQLFNIKNVPIKVKFTNLKPDIISCVPSSSMNYYDESHD